MHIESSPNHESAVGQSTTARASSQGNYTHPGRINNMSEILTAQEVAAMLRISKRQVYELAKETENPIPSIRIRTSVR